MEKKTGYSTTTYRMQLYTKHMNWMYQTKELFNHIVKFYYVLLLEHNELLELSNQKLMRELEIWTIGEKQKKKEPIYPLPYEKVPLYFRRAAINCAISLSRSYHSKLKNWEKKTKEGLEHEKWVSKPKSTRNFRASPVYYAGMYKNLTDSSITLKLWNGERWIWETYHYKTFGRKLPDCGKYLSPSLKITEKKVFLHIPVETVVEDIRNIQERIEDGEKICAVYFPSNNKLAVCVQMDRKGNEISFKYIKGGDKLRAQRKRNEGRMKKALVRKYESIEKIEEADEKNIEAICRPYKDTMRNMNENCAHQVSREIINYCEENAIKIIVVPKYETSLELNRKGYIKDADYDWIGRKIERYIRYKAFQRGIVVGTVKPYYIVSKCSICGKKIKKYNEGNRPNEKYHGGELFLCENGHQGNTALNAARNVGKFFLEYNKRYWEPQKAEDKRTNIHAIHFECIA